jgi:C4-dicarboxylate-specific signal transduction histidine kinase
MRQTVLIVDDVPDNIRILVSILKDDYNIRVARNGVDALENSLLHPMPNLILLDIMMPEEVVIKLLKNSVEIFEKRDIKNPKIEIFLYLKEKLEISIRDNGGGVDDELLQKIFDPYFSTKIKLQERGLGLYASRTIVENHLRGELKIENIEDGVIAKIELPIKGE